MISPRFKIAARALALVCLAVAAHAAEGPTLENPLLALGFEAAHGGLVSVREPATAQGHLNTGDGPGELWELRFAGQETPPVLPSQARAFHWTCPEKRNETLRLEWGDFGLAAAPALRVIATVSLRADQPESAWRLSLENLGTQRPESLVFPRIEGMDLEAGAELAVPYWMGERTNRLPEVLFDAQGQGRRVAWDYPGTLSMQCLALYQPGGPGLYLSCGDTGALLKSFAVFGGKPGQAGLEMTHLPEQTAARDGRYELPYPVWLGAFRGDWFTVAERYRAWGLAQAWARESRLKQGRVPDWGRDTALWVWNRGRSTGVLGPAQALRAHSGLPVSVFWHWWHGCAYDMGFPEYLPPREGDEAFRGALDAAHAAGVHAIVYMNQRLWGMRTNTWTEEGAAAFAVKDAAGVIQPEVYNTFTKAPCASMCMGTDFWRGKYAGLAESAVRGLGVDGIYMDQACSSLACYNPAHGHSIGGGGYWIQGFQRLAADIRSRCDAARRVVLAGEGCGEAWLPHLDLMLSLQVSMERYAAPGLWEPIPFFHAAYHGHAIFYGNYSSLTMPPYDDLWPAESAPAEPLKLLDPKFSRQFRLEQARAFVWGQQPTVANFLPAHLETRGEEVAYALQLAALRMKALEFLLHGAMLCPPEFTAPTETIDISRLSIYAGQQEALKEYTKEVPTVIGSAWRAEDGRVGVVFASIAGTASTVSVTLDRQVYGIAEDATVRRITAESGEGPMPLPAGPVSLGVHLPARSACVYVFQ